LKDFKNDKSPSLSWGGDYSSNIATVAIYSQNYLFLKHILKLEKQNQEIIEQNQQIIDLLAKIESKQ